MAKHIKIIEGHSSKEWESKFHKKIAKKKIKVFNNEKDLIDYATYWKINGKYYQVPGAFEWYTKSLRKSKGLTIALTCTSILATFFLTAALVQSQVKWKADKYGLSVSLYAEEGTFEDGSKSKVITGITKGTKLKEIKDYYKIYIPHRNDYEFKKWYYDDGEPTPTVFPEDSEIINNVSLKAYFELKPRDPVNFGGRKPGEDCDSWETVYNVIKGGKEFFIDTYCKDQPSYPADKDEALLEFMDSTENWRTLSVGNVADYGVRLIGVGQDHEYDGVDDHELFTFEFNECIIQNSYSYEQGGSPFYTKSGSEAFEDPDAPEKHDYCYLKSYYDSDLLPQLPIFIQDNIKSVTKKTLQIHKGFSYAHDDVLESWVFDPKCLTGEDSANPDRVLEMTTTEEKLFSLSIDEIGGATIDFETPDKFEGGKELIGQTIQANQNYIDYYKDEEREILAEGEGFSNGTSNRGAYMFYQDEWSTEEGAKHTDSLKRMKRCFLGDDEEGINTQYRLRSIYIPNEYDVDDTSGAQPRTSGNKDYRCFETWNISPDGGIGNPKVSGKINPNTSERYHFMCGDMAWAGIYVAPAFCL